ncbi:hypothetical protein [Rhodocyclus tenuis]|uniref:hypothetical protein n=1 Tax=Rhodocyclus tenuis TaxID=1066 RepID=UPI00190618F0|nr:hypothetical protein [Rhodocyclus tenuis]
MIRYIHFSFPNLYLANGYREFTTPVGVEREYESPDKLEQCIRCLVLRKNEPLRGWDLRFLRRGLELSQAELGLLLDRDAQTIARWEKSAEPIPKFVDLTIRTRFAAHFEPKMSINQLLSHVDGCGKPLPEKVVLSNFDGEWYVQLEQRITFETGSVLAEIAAELPAWRDTYQVLLETQRKPKEIGYVYAKPEFGNSIEAGYTADLSNTGRTSISHLKRIGNIVRRETENTSVSLH